MTRAERKKNAQIKRCEIKNQILSYIDDVYEKTGDVLYSLASADGLVDVNIKLNPQESHFWKAARDEVAYNIGKINGIEDPAFYVMNYVKFGTIVY